MQRVQSGPETPSNDGFQAQPENGLCGNHKAHGSQSDTLADVYRRAIRGTLLSQLQAHIQSYRDDEAHFIGMVEAGTAIIKGCPDAIVADILADLLIEEKDALAAQPKSADDPWRLVDAQAVRKSYQRVRDYQPRACEDVPIKQNLTPALLARHTCPANPDSSCIGTACQAFRRSRVPYEHQDGRGQHEINCSHIDAPHRGTIAYVDRLLREQLHAIPEYKKHWPPVRPGGQPAPGTAYPKPPAPAAPAITPEVFPDEREHDTKPAKLGLCGDDATVVVLDPDVALEGELAADDDDAIERELLIEQAAATGGLNDAEATTSRGNS